jgi:radical SAM protein
VFYEVTRACDLVCKHCRASAQPERHPEELSGEQARQLIRELASFPKPPLLVFTGGDPIKRADIYDLIRHSVAVGLEVAMTPSATPLVTREAVRKLKEAGVSRLAISLDGADAATHDEFRGVTGTFERATAILSWCRELGLPTQINTTVTRRNVGQIDQIAELCAEHEIVLWSVFFLIPVGRGLAEQRIPAAQYEEVFERLWHHAQRQPFSIKTTEAHHYRRFVLQRHGDPLNAREDAINVQRAPLGVNDGKGCMFVSHVGEIQPSGFMPLICGRFPQDSVVKVYQNSATFRSLRDPDGFGGKCGVCEYRQVCGGSRARAYTVTGDPVAAEPDCVYVPARWAS